MKTPCISSPNTTLPSHYTSAQVHFIAVHATKQFQQTLVLTVRLFNGVSSFRQLTVTETWLLTQDFKSTARQTCERESDFSLTLSPLSFGTTNFTLLKMVDLIICQNSSANDMAFMIRIQVIVKFSILHKI